MMSWFAETKKYVEQLTCQIESALKTAKQRYYLGISAHCPVESAARRHLSLIDGGQFHVHEYINVHTNTCYWIVSWIPIADLHLQNFDDYRLMSIVLAEPGYCGRCGFTSHTIEKCFAKRHRNGHAL